VRRRCCFAQLQVLHIQDSVILDSMTCRFGFSWYILFYMYLDINISRCVSV
jgi:hypothetical protein